MLDRRRRPVPIGVPGELWIAGDGVAQGYVGRPELTAERFVVQTLSPTLEERLYRTGDLVRWLGDGTIEFIGRLDDQVKIRGFRVELGEIEATLARHPRVQNAAVVARRTPDGEARLVGYVVGAEPLDPRELREFLQRALPPYMIPTTFVRLDRLPAERQRQGRRLGSARAGALARTRSAGRAAGRARAAARGHLAGRPFRRACRHPRQLLRPRGPFAPGHPDGRAHRERARHRAAARDTVRGAHHRGPGRGHSPWSASGLRTLAGCDPGRREPRAAVRDPGGDGNRPRLPPARPAPGAGPAALRTAIVRARRERAAADEDRGHRGEVPAGDSRDPADRAVQSRRDVHGRCRGLRDGPAASRRRREGRFSRAPRDVAAGGCIGAAASAHDARVGAARLHGRTPPASRGGAEAPARP